MLPGFLATLATLTPQSSEWHECMAGMSAVRAADWAMSPRGCPAESFESFRARGTLTADATLRRLLDGVLRWADPSAPDAFETRVGSLAVRLDSLGAFFHETGRPGEAADVFAVALRGASSDVSLRMQITLHLAKSLRQARRLEDADHTYTALEALAIAHHDTYMRLSALVGRGIVAGNRGDYPRAIALLDDAIEDAKRCGEHEMLRRAYVQRATFAGACGDIPGALRFANAAVRGMTDPLLREVLYGNIANALRELGQTVAARTVADFVLRTARRPLVRHAVLVTRYHVAIDERDWMTCVRMNDQLAVEHLTPSVAADYYHARARESAVRGDLRTADAYLIRMLAVAQEYELAEQIIRADAAIDAVRGGLVPARYVFEPHAPTRAEERTSVMVLAGTITDDIRDLELDVTATVDVDPSGAVVTFG